MSRTLLPLLLLVVAALPAPAQDDAPRPRSVLFLLSDDQRFDAVGAHGNPHVRTPNLDALVARGTSFERAYCLGSSSGAVCAPSRAMLMTGRAYFRIQGNIFDPPPGPGGSPPLLPELLGQAGWNTFATGKWHNGRRWFQRAFQGGGALFFGGMGSHTELGVHDFDLAGAYPNDARHPLGGFSSTVFADQAVEFLRTADAERPFFLYVAFTAPHDPRTPPPEFRELYRPEDLPLPPDFLPVHPFDNGELVIRDERLAPWPRTPEVVREHLADYYGMVSQLDAQVGRILAALDESGRADETLVVFASDHGLALGSHGLLGKQNLYEHSTRAPLILAGPGVPRGERSRALVWLHDLVPTLLDLLALEAPGLREELDGSSLAPILSGEREGVRDTIFTAYRDLQRAVRDERWKLIRYPKVHHTQLFDLERDPFELHDLAADPDQAARVEALTEELAEWQRRLGDDAPLTAAERRPLEFDFEGRGR